MLKITKILDKKISTSFNSMRVQSTKITKRTTFRNATDSAYSIWHDSLKINNYFMSCASKNKILCALKTFPQGAPRPGLMKPTCHQYQATHPSTVQEGESSLPNLG